MSYGFCSKFCTLSSNGKIFENLLRFDKVTESLKVGRYLKHSVGLRPRAADPCDDTSSSHSKKRAKNYTIDPDILASGQNLQRQHPNLSLADEINDFFVSVSEHLPPFKNDQCSTIVADYTQDYIVLLAEIERRLSRINVHKAPGPDGLPNWLLKDFASLISDPLAAIFNASLREGYLPPIWKAAKVVPVPKVSPPMCQVERRRREDRGAKGV